MHTSGAECEVKWTVWASLSEWVKWWGEKTTTQTKTLHLKWQALKWSSCSYGSVSWYPSDNKGKSGWLTHTVHQPTWWSRLSPPAVGFSACPGSPLVLTLQPARQRGRRRLHQASSTVTLSSKAEYQTVIFQTLLRAFVVYLISFSHLYWTWASLHTKLTAFGKVTCKGKKSDGVASCCLLNNQGRQVVFALADNRVVSSLYYFPA